MNKNKQWRLLSLFGEGAEGEAKQTSAPTPQTSEQTGDTASMGAPAAGESNEAKRRSEDFRALMEGEYKELFTAYFQETFNRRFKEQKEMKEELESVRAVVHAAAEHFGVEQKDLLGAIRTENERKRASAVSPEQPLHTAESPMPDRQKVEREIRQAVESARAETERSLLATIRARGLRPAEGALSTGVGDALRRDVSHLSRAQRAEVARRAAKGERIKL